MDGEVVFNPNEGQGEPAVGYRFHPTDEEIIDYYLKLKINGYHSLVDNFIGEVDHLYQLEPWDLPDRSQGWSNDQVWYFFCRLDYKYANSKRANRATVTGFWKATGKVRHVKAKGREIGTKRTLVFHSKGNKVYPDSKPVRTSWVIHEYQAKTVLPAQTTYVVCKLKNKSDEQTENLPCDEGEPSHRMAAGADNNAAQATIPELQAEPALEPQVDSNHGISVLDLLQPNYSDNDLIGRFQFDTSEEEVDPIKFTDSMLAFTDEYYSEETVHTLPNDCRAPQSLSQVYFPESSDTDTEVVHAEYFTTTGASKLFCGQTSSKAYRQMVGASSVDAATTGPKSINCIQEVAAELQSAYKPQHQPRATDLKADKGVTSRGIQLLSKTTRVPKDKARDTTRHGTVTDLPEKKRFSMQSESDRKMVQVTNAKPNLKMRSNDSASSDWKGSIIHQGTPPSSYRPSPPWAYLLNVVVGLSLFIFLVMELLNFHH